MSNIEYDVRLKDQPQSDRVDGDELSVLLGTNAVHWNALRLVIEWWDGLPPNLRQDIEGSGKEPGAIAAARTALPYAPSRATPQQSGNSGEATVVSGCILCANGNDLPEGEHCRSCGREGSASGLRAAVIKARGRQEPPTTPVHFDTPKPAPDAVRQALFKREPRAGGYAFVTAPAFPGWSFMLTPVCPEAREQEMRLSLVAFLEAEALAVPVPSPEGAALAQHLRIYAMLLSDSVKKNLIERAADAIDPPSDPTPDNPKPGIAQHHAAGDTAMKQIWKEWFEFYQRHFRGAGTVISAADQMAFYEIAQPILRDLYATPPVRGDREAIARIIDPIAFTALERTHIVPEHDEFNRMKLARDKADAILSLPVQPGAGEPKLRTVLADARAAIASLPMEALGYASAENNQAHWPIRDELLHRIDEAMPPCPQGNADV